MSKYYIFSAGIVRGPFPLENMALMLADGRISFDTPVSLGKSTPWRTVADHQEIKDAANALQNNTSRTATVADKSKERHKVVFYCPECNQKYSGDESWLGRDIVCMACGKVFTAGNQEKENIPTPAAEAEPVPSNNAPDTVITSIFTPGPDTVADSIPAAGTETFNWANCDGEILCPHCWQRFNSEQLLYIASHPTLMGDPVLGSNAMQRFSPGKFNALGQALDAMGSVSNDVACPRCHLKIPLTVIDEKNISFSLVGAPSSGKSYYLATLLNVLRRILPEKFACTLLDVDLELNRVLDSYEETLFHASRRNEVAVLPKTQQTGDDFVNVVTLDNIAVHLPKPFVYEIKYFSGSEQHNNSNIIFYDNAGEQFEPGADTISNPGTRHLACSDGLIFIFDPVNDALMRENCNQEDPQLQSDEHVYEQTKLLSEMISRIRRHRNMNTGKRSDIPLVIAVGKYDAWKDLLMLSTDSASMYSPQDGKLSNLWNRNAVMDISFKLRTLLMKYVPELVHTAEGFFENVVFVPFSSFGCASSTSSSGQLGVVPAMIKPLWVEVPFLFLLEKCGLIHADTTPEYDEKIAAEFVSGYMLFRHPGNGDIVRLPQNYAGSVLDLNGKRYKLAGEPTADNAPAAGDTASDLWV